MLPDIGETLELLLRLMNQTNARRIRCRYMLLELKQQLMHFVYQGHDLFIHACDNSEAAIYRPHSVE